jgi:hypothetical protein
MATTGIAIAMVRRWSRSRAMRGKVERLQQKFQSQDRIGDMPNNT